MGMSEHTHADHQPKTYLDTMFAHSPEGLLLLDPNLRVVKVNPAFEQLTGWRAEGIAGRHCYETIRCHDMEGKELCEAGCPALAARWGRDKSTLRSVSMVSPSGDATPLNANYALAPEEVDEGYVIIAAFPVEEPPHCAIKYAEPWFGTTMLVPPSTWH
jgi:PAS domain S-box-containing protein